MNLNKLKSKKQEKRVAKEVGGNTTPASGAFWSAKADVRSKLFLIECKTTEKDFYALTYTTWNKIYNEALKDGMKIPVMCVDLNNGRDKIAVLSTYDLGNFCPPCSAYEAIQKTNKASYRIKFISNGSRFTLSSSKQRKVFDLSAIPWEGFLLDTLPYYEQEMLK